ncbi:micrococcal nuclease [Sphingomonas sp. SORGH_AS 950]|uniref:thermonuclease family protein n=1 Tax=Sphingomonas sp. SORGH_AS_0950 TaxID=3041792 RepID=UPI0027810489|nr:thermonuclease family protein [Sphingomonas sp. SORGH_AS_0950]MDQ1158915.1 micrococcal nuclease [Sphingomonas sp. SORGH_AS_0950]
MPEPETARIVFVTDGDTVRLEGGERIRIAGIDAPETHDDQAHGRAEIAMGRAAAQTARAMLLGEVVTIERVGRSYNRTVARLTLGGHDVGTELVRQGAARWWPRWERKPDWCGAGEAMRRARRGIRNP